MIFLQFFKKQNFAQIFQYLILGKQRSKIIFKKYAKRKG